jgi:hypothetical protein
MELTSSTLTATFDIPKPSASLRSHPLHPEHDRAQHLIRKQYLQVAQWHRTLTSKTKIILNIMEKRQDGKL